MIYEEIFGFEAAPMPSAKAAPVLPWERTDAQGLAKWLQPASEGSDLVCNKVQDVAMVKQLVGELPTPLQTVPELEPIFNAPRATTDLLKLARRIENTDKQRTLAGIVSEFRKKLGGPNDPAAWDRLKRSCENYLQQALAEVA